MNFNQPEEEFLDGDDVVGLGVLGKEGSGRLRAQVCLSCHYHVVIKVVNWVCVHCPATSEDVSMQPECSVCVCIK